MSKHNRNDIKKILRIEASKQEKNKKVIMEKKWKTLMDKHELRYEIWSLLKVNYELNVTEISNLVKQSKSTVSRVLIGMKKDDLILSRRGETKKSDGEKIPPKFYRINVEFN